MTGRMGLALAVMLVPGIALAGGAPPRVTSNSWNGTITDNWNTNMHGGAGGAGGMGGSSISDASSASGSSAVGGGNSHVSVGGANVPRQAPSVALGVATAYCQNNGGLGGSGPGFSVFGFMGRHDKDCIRFNYAMILEAMGFRMQAVEVMKNNPEVAAAFVAAPVAIPVTRPTVMQPIVSPGDPGYRGPARRRVRRPRCNC